MNIDATDVLLITAFLITVAFFVGLSALNAVYRLGYRSGYKVARLKGQVRVRDAVINAYRQVEVERDEFERELNV